MAEAGGAGRAEAGLLPYSLPAGLDRLSGTRLPCRHPSRYRRDIDQLGRTARPVAEGTFAPSKRRNRQNEQLPPMTEKTVRNPRTGTTKEREAEYESVGADVLVDYVREDVKTRVETLRARLRRLGKPQERR
jgi:hypothetical protein